MKESLLSGTGLMERILLN